MMRHLLSMALCLCLLIPVSTSKAQEKPADTGDLSAAVELLRTVEKTNIHYAEPPNFLSSVQMTRAMPRLTSVRSRRSKSTRH